jgi:hypothetical protein
MVMSTAASAVHGLAVRRPQYIDLTVVSQLLQGAVDRGQADAFAGSAQSGVQILRADEGVDVIQSRGNGGPLPGLPALGRRHQ